MLKPYPKYKDSSVSWIGMVPQGWEVTVIGRVAKILLGKMLNQKEQTGDGVYKQYISAKDVHFDGIDLSDLKSMFFKNNELEKYKVKQGDVLVVEGGAGSGGTFVFNDNIEVMVQNHVHRLRCSDKISNKYLYFWMYSIVSRGYIDAVCNKATIPTFPSEKVFNTQIPLPPRSEQDAIVAYLDDKTAKIDRLIGLYKREIELLKERRQAVIHKAVTQGLDDKVKLKDSGVSWIGMVPQGWEVKRLKHQVHLIKDKADNNDNYIGLENIEGWSGKYINVSSDYPPEGISIKIESGDILFGKLRPYLAKCYIVNNEKCCSTEFFVLRCYLNNKYLSYMMRSPIFINDVNMSTYGTKMPRTNWDYVGNMSIPLPPRSEQDDIVAYLDDQCAKVDAMIGKVQSKIGLLEEYRVRLISDVVTGKVRV